MINFMSAFRIKTRQAKPKENLSGKTALIAAEAKAMAKTDLFNDKTTLSKEKFSQQHQKCSDLASSELHISHIVERV